MTNDYTKPALPESRRHSFDAEYSADQVQAHADACVAAATDALQAELAECNERRSETIAMCEQLKAELKRVKALRRYFGLPNVVPQPVSGAADTVGVSDVWGMATPFGKSLLSDTPSWEAWPLQLPTKSVSGAADPVGQPTGEQTNQQAARIAELEAALGSVLFGVSPTTPEGRTRLREAVASARAVLAAAQEK
jgi:hypothetical protein